jgi:hypothetical protein
MIEFLYAIYAWVARGVGGRAALLSDLLRYNKTKAPLSPSDSSPNKLAERDELYSVRKFCAPTALLGELFVELSGQPNTCVDPKRIDQLRITTTLHNRPSVFADLSP